MRHSYSTFVQCVPSPISKKSSCSKTGKTHIHKSGYLRPLGGLAVKEMQVVQLDSAQLRLWVQWALHLSTATALRTWPVPLLAVPPKMYIPSAISLHTAAYSKRAVGAVPLKVTSDHHASMLRLQIFCPWRQSS